MSTTARPHGQPRRVLTLDARIGCYVVVVRDEHVLPVHSADADTWSLPGGGLEVGEQSADAAVREVREETGYDVALDGLLSAGADGSTDDARWVPLAGLDSWPCSPEVIEALQRLRRHHPGGWVHSPTRVTTGE